MEAMMAFNNLLTHRFNKMADQRNQTFSDLRVAPVRNLHNAPEGAWSSLDILQHLFLSESGILKLLQKQVLKPASDFHTVKFKNKYRSLALNLSLLSTFRYKAPAVVTHFESKMELSELQKEWEHFENSMRALIENFPESHKNKVIFRHPRAGWITMKATLDFMRFHQLHHIRQIKDRAGYETAWVKWASGKIEFSFFKAAGSNVHSRKKIVTILNGSTDK